MYWLAFNGANLVGRSCLGVMGERELVLGNAEEQPPCSIHTSARYQPFVLERPFSLRSTLCIGRVNILQNLLANKQKKKKSFSHLVREGFWGGNVESFFVEKIVTRHLVTFQPIPRELS